jgi:hypothetical protein
MHRAKFMIVVGALLVFGRTEATAQGTAAGQASQMWQAWNERGYFNFNIAFETTSGTLSDSVTFPIYDENGTKSVQQNVDSGSLIDFSVGSRVWRNVSAGIGYHRGSNTSEASATASVPHPLVFTSNRATAASASDLQRVESAFHIQFGYMFVFSEVLTVHATIGPSFFNLDQDVLADLTFSDPPPHNVVTATPVIQERSDSATGINIGVDATYQLYDGGDYKAGAGVFLRYAGASARIRVLEGGNEVDSDVGGIQIGFGARVRF